MAEEVRRPTVAIHVPLKMLGGQSGRGDIEDFELERLAEAPIPPLHGRIWQDLNSGKIKHYGGPGNGLPQVLTVLCEGEEYDSWPTLAQNRWRNVPLVPYSVGSAPGTATLSNGVVLYAFSATAKQQLAFSAVIGKDGIEGSTAHLDFFFTHNVIAPSGVIRVGASVITADDIGAVMNNLNVVTNVSVQARYSKHGFRVSVPGVSPGDVVNVLFYRDASHGNDTFSSTAMFLHANLLYQIDKIGGDAA